MVTNNNTKFRDELRNPNFSDALRQAFPCRMVPQAVKRRVDAQEGHPRAAGSECGFQLLYGLRLVFQRRVHAGFEVRRDIPLPRKTPQGFDTAPRFVLLSVPRESL